MASMVVRAAILLLACSAALYFLVPAAWLANPIFQGGLLLAGIGLAVAAKLWRRGPVPRPDHRRDNRFLWLGLGLLIGAPLWLALMAIIFTHMADQSLSDFKVRLLSVPFMTLLAGGFSALGYRLLLWLGK